MAQRRMISKSISTSVKLSEVSTFACLLFTWIIPHCDDLGHMDGSAKLVKGIVVPLRDETVDDVEKSIQELVKKGLIERYEVDGKQYIEISQWTNHQTFKTDRPLTELYPRNPLDSIRKPKDSKRLAKLSEVKRSEVKLSEVKGESSVKYLESVPKEDIESWTKRFIVTEKDIRSKAEDLKLYCERRGKKYSNYKSFLLNAIKRDFKERDGKDGKYSNL